MPLPQDVFPIKEYTAPPGPVSPEPTPTSGFLRPLEFQPPAELQGGSIAFPAYSGKRLSERVHPRITFSVYLDNTERRDERPGSDGRITYLDSYLDEIILPFMKAGTETVTMDGNPIGYEGPDAQGKIVFYRLQPGDPPGGAVSGKVTVSYEIDWDSVACGSENMAPILFKVRNYSLTSADSPYFGMGTIAYASFWIEFQALDFCDRLFQALLEAGYVDANGIIQYDDPALLQGYTGVPVSPSSPGWGWSMPNHYRRVEALAGGHLIYKDGGTSVLRWLKSGDSYVPVEPKNLVKAGLLDDGRIVLSFPDQTRLYFDTPENRGRILAEEDSNGNTLTYEYEPGPGGFLANVNDGRGRFLYFVHGSDGQPTALRDVRGTKARDTSFEYYEEGLHRGKLRAQISPVGDRIEMHYDDATGLLRQVQKVFPAKDPADEPRRLIEVEFTYYTEGLDAGKVRTETFLIDPDTGKGQRRNTYSYMARSDGNREVTVLLEDLAETAAEPRSTTQVFDRQDRLVEATDALGNMARYVYGDARHPKQPTQVIDPNLASTHLSYNDQGNVVHAIDPDGNETRHVYCEDLYGDSRPEHWNLLYEVHRPKVQDPFRGRYDLQSFPPTKFAYDSKRNLESVTDAKGQVTLFTRRADGLVTEVRDRRGNVTRFDYNEHRNLRSITTPGTPGVAPELTTLLSYDPEQFDRVASMTDPSGAVWAYEYDDLERLIRTTDPRGHSVSFEYEQGLLKTVVAPPNHGSSNQDRRTSYRYDLAEQLERVLAEVTPGGSEQMRVRYEYDGFGQLRSLVRLMNGTEKKTTYQYDKLGRHTATTDPLMRTSRTEYSKSCKERTHVSAEGRRNTLNMDQLCRLTQLENREGSTTFTYDHWSRVRQVVQPDGRATRYGESARGTHRYGDFDAFSSMAEYQYDELDRLVRFFSPPDRRPILYEYDPESNVTAVVDAVGRRTEYTYLNDNRLRTVTQDGQTFRYEYGADGRLQRLHYPKSTNIVADLGWDAAGNLEQIHYKRGGVSLHKMAYMYDPSGNRSHFIDTPMDLTQARTWEYRYDGLNRLKAVHHDGVLASFYDFDESDNRLRMDKMLDRVLHRYDYSYDAADQISDIKRDDVPLFEFRHDRDGNMTSKNDLATARSDSYAWNDDGRLVIVSVEESGQPKRVTRNDYDAGNIRKRRIGADGSKVNYYYSGLLALTTVGAEGPTSFLLGHQVLGYTRAGESYWFITDALGSVRALVDSAGDIVSTCTYDEWGVSDDGLYLQALGVAPEGTLSSCRVRFVDFSIGRFLSQDSMPYSRLLPSSINRYAYSGNSPINYADPSGYAGTPHDSLTHGLLQAYRQYGLQGVIEFAAIHGVSILGPNSQQFWSRLPDLIERSRRGAAICPAVAQAYYAILNRVAHFLNQNGTGLKTYPSPTVLQIDSTKGIYWTNELGRRIWVGNTHWAIEWNGRIFDAFTGLEGVASNVYLRQFAASPGRLQVGPAGPAAVKMMTNPTPMPIP